MIRTNIKFFFQIFLLLKSFSPLVDKSLLKKSKINLL